MGQLKDETKGVPITCFVSAGPKNYSYQLEDGTEVCKIRGFTLNHRCALVLNFDSMRELVITPANRDGVIEVEEPYKIIRKGGHIFTEPQTKTYRMVYNKRRLLDDLSTLPFGWK